MTARLQAKLLSVHWVLQLEVAAQSQLQPVRVNQPNLANKYRNTGYFYCGSWDAKLVGSVYIEDDGRNHTKIVTQLSVQFCTHIITMCYKESNSTRWRTMKTTVDTLEYKYWFPKFPKVQPALPDGSWQSAEEAVSMPVLKAIIWTAGSHHQTSPNQHQHGWACSHHSHSE